MRFNVLKSWVQSTVDWVMIIFIILFGWRVLYLCPFFMLEKVLIFSILFRERFYFRISSLEHVFSPLVIVVSSETHPFLKYFIFSFDYSLLPFFIMPNVIVVIVSVVSMVNWLFISLWCLSLLDKNLFWKRASKLGV